MKTYLGTVLIFLLVTGGCTHHNDPVPEVQVTTFLKPLNENAQWYITFDMSDNLYISDMYNNVIRKVTPNQTVSTFAGSGASGLVDAVGSQAQLYRPQGITFDGAGNLYVAQYLALRKITPTGTVSTIAGIDFRDVSSLKPDSTLFVTTPSLVADRTMNLFIADYTDLSYKNRILKLTPDGKISVFVGRKFSYPGLTPQKVEEEVRRPKGIAFDSNANLFIADEAFGIIKVSPNGVASHFSGAAFAGHADGPATTAMFGEITSLAIDKSDNLYVGDGQYIRKVTPDGTVTTIAGNSTPPVIQYSQSIYKDGNGSQAQFYQPQSMAFDSKGNLFVADAGGIRKITFPQ